ncbi:MAG TPA: fumarate hydratase [Methanothermobacter sp.]|jgi:fumarate hydratase subunit beta|uniref:Fumarate hydratase n=1 Tax=Methanothermobacter tenebrarum TaxID=680118 RepID=A0ABM7YC50_9EURY|nr:fumarate hydratase C-terminal domain-containing protein [Methanothermobacter tenebrarum]MDD3454017.1 fumarate hydratase C-terminal domain-containing protein [Methanobacteriales archaeon]MDI6882244.1 fumarate hydratase C-terminal domain-containing protein [Methanothermobacter sp.]MDX9693695.1 fumarate hydratase C-terminal domain-containing protein [Methanothermobacter sp.]BDH78918.1 fumarate hydratase [Methanothermobacter tenebrarum]HHW17125.1 fumarate hydratase [Methanothermobacter sp.]
MIEIRVPSTVASLKSLEVGDRILLKGRVYTGRDAVLPRLVEAVKAGRSPVDLKGAAIMHTGVSGAGIAPTSSNKEDIEDSIPFLASAGVLIHIGKGSLRDETVRGLDEAGAIFVVTPPVAALLSSRVRSKRLVAYGEEGMEALYELEVEGFPGIVAVAHGKSII